MELGHSPETWSEQGSTKDYIEIELILLLEYFNLTLLLYSCCNNIGEMQRITLDCLFDIFMC